jgi:DNA-binding CsgD family transcriptional regulator
MSDFLTRRQFHHTGLYAEFFRPVGVEYQMAVGIATRPGIVVGIALNRKLTDFSAAEKTLLEYLCPHLQQAYRNAQAMDLALRQRGQAEELLESVAPGMAIVSATGRIHQATPAARSMLEKYYRSGGGSDQLPEEVTRWLRGQVALLGDGDPTRPCLPLIEEGRGHWLTIRLLVRPGESHCLVLQEHSIEQRIAAYMRLGLTARQAQVLAWMSIGKSDSEIAILLSTSPRTIEKHLEHIYDRLDVPSRLQAVVRALEIFR